MPRESVRIGAAITTQKAELSSRKTKIRVKVCVGNKFRWIIRATHHFLILINLLARSKWWLGGWIVFFIDFLLNSDFSASNLTEKRSLSDVSLRRARSCNCLQKKKYFTCRDVSNCFNCDHTALQWKKATRARNEHCSSVWSLPNGACKGRGWNRTRSPKSTIIAIDKGKEIEMKSLANTSTRTACLSDRTCLLGSAWRVGRGLTMRWVSWSLDRGSNL